MASNLAMLQTAVKVKSALGSIGSSPMESETQVKGEDTDDLITKVTSSWIYMICIGGIVSAFLSMFVTISTLVDVASITVLGLAPYTVYQKRKLESLGGMRGQQNALRQSVNEFSDQNNKLTANVSSMEMEVTGLKEVEGELEVITKKYGDQTDRLVEIVKENGALQAKIKKNLEAQVLQNVLQVLIGSDRDMNFALSKKELKRLKLQLSNIPGITLDEDNFDKLCGNHDLKTHDIMDMFRNLKADIPEEDNIFHLEPDQLVKRRFF